MPAAVPAEPARKDARTAKAVRNGARRRGVRLRRAPQTGIRPNGAALPRPMAMEGRGKPRGIARATASAPPY